MAAGIAPATLYVVATPIGNLGDITARACTVLAAVDRIYAEDTRHSRRLLQHLGIATPLQALHDHNEAERAERLAQRLAGGECAALISDAGTPLVSDPGYRVVRACQAAGVRVVPVPGPSALLAALCASGLATDRFAFEGFAPAKAAARRAHFAALAGEPRSLVFFESSHRVCESLTDMAAAFGADREACLARELTKRFESVRRASLGELCQWLDDDPDQRRGEFVIAVAAAPQRTAGDEELRRSLEALLPELAPRRAAAVAARLCGVSRNRAYSLALQLRGDGPESGPESGEARGEDDAPRR